MSTARERLMDLLTDRALVGLGQREQIELAELLLQVEDVDVGAFDAAASSIALATIGSSALAALPSRLADTLEETALATFDAGASAARPASDYAKTRQIEKLAPGMMQTQIDPTFAPPPESIEPLSEEEDPNDYKRTLQIDNGPPPASAPTALTMVNARAPHAPAPLTQRQPSASALAQLRPSQSQGHVAGPAQNTPAPHFTAGSGSYGAPRNPAAFTPTSAPVLPSPHPARPSLPSGVLSGVPSGMPSGVPSGVPSSGAYGTDPRGASNVVPFAPRGPSRAVAISGWIAAAACLALAIGAYVLKSPSDPIAIRVPPITTVPTTNVPVPSVAPAALQTPAQLREALLAAQGSARAEWSPTKDPLGKAATGEVVWNKDQQRGTMRFRGLAKNDPKLAQYQLWIFDKTRDDKYPVDGGVFDVDSETGDVVVPIRATLPVSAPVLFAVTLEKPGGVVVSKRDRIVVTAKLPTG